MDMEEAEKGTEKLCSDFDSIKVKQLSFSYPGRKLRQFRIFLLQ